MRLYREAVGFQSPGPMRSSAPWVFIAIVVSTPFGTAVFLVPSPPRNDMEKGSIHYVLCMSFLGGEGEGEGHAGATRRKRT